MYKRRLAAALANRPVRKQDGRKAYARCFCALVFVMLFAAVAAWAAYVIWRNGAATGAALNDDDLSVRGSAPRPAGIPLAAALSRGAAHPAGRKLVVPLTQGADDFSAEIEHARIVASLLGDVAQPDNVDAQAARVVGDADSRAGLAPAGTGADRGDEPEHAPAPQPAVPGQSAHGLLRRDASASGATADLAAWSEADAPGSVAAPQPPAAPQHEPASQPGLLPPLPAGKRALLFTMDSITDYVAKAAGGGPAGEILVRESLEWGLAQLGVALDVATSDAEFARLSARPDDYALFFLDPWTYVAPGWVPRAFLKGRERRAFLVSFFGLSSIEHGLALPLAHVLTPYPSNGANTFLGLAMAPRWLARGSSSSSSDVPAVGPGAPQPPLPLPAKKRQGIVWGKRAEYFSGKLPLLEAVAKEVDTLIVTVPPGSVPGLEAIPNVRQPGHLSRQQWHALLAESAFLLGLGDPLLGPSALDAVAAGTAFINPAYAEARRVGPSTFPFGSQHPFLEERVGEPHACTVAAAADPIPGTLRCVAAALAALSLPAGGLAPLVPPEMAPEAYLRRLDAIVRPVLEEEGGGPPGA